MDSFQDSRLLAGLLHGIEDLAKRPADALLPYEDQIAALSTQLQRLEANVNAHARRASLPLLEPFVSPLDRYHFTDSLEPDFGACPELNPGSISNSSSVSMSSGNDTNPTTTISHLVSSAFVHFRSASPRLRKLQSIPFDRWFAQDERLVHLRPIFNMQKNRMSRASDPKERLLLINSCMSLADEFRDFEVERGWSAKQDILTDCIIHNQPLAVQKIGKHSQEFVHSLKLSNRMDVSDLDDRRLDAGLRLGTKLNVVRQVGKACGYGSVLALLMAFELSKLSRLPYHALKYLRSVCCFSNTESIEEVTKEFDEWWESCCLAYRKKFGSARVDYGKSCS